MSRLIVRNLPKSIKVNELREVFKSKGCVTDMQLKFSDKGVFRQFAFVGYKTEEEAEAAKDYFDNTYIKASKIKVDICTSIGDVNKPKPWSKYSKVKNITADKEKDEEKLGDNKEKKKEKKHKVDGLEAFPEKLRKDPKFVEFLDLNKSRLSKPVWCDDAGEFIEAEEDAVSSDDDEVDVDGTEESKKVDEKVCSDTDMKKKEKEHDDHFTVKLRNLPYKCKKKNVKKFFQPLKPQSIRIPPKARGFAYVRFKTEKDMKQALNKNKGFLDGHRIDVVKYEKKYQDKASDNNVEEKEKEDEKNNEELLAESGRIYVRNLYFDVTEDELEKLFSKYGPITEIHLPFDSYTKKSLGFAFVTYMFAEHAVKAFSELDGIIFQGRNLHLIPAKPKKEMLDDISELPYKKKKEAEIKALSGSSHNWNTLFLGLNAVADVISKRHNIEKSELLSAEIKESLPVRMALGETQLVVETRNFLIDNGVELDAFSQPAAERSKTVILVKNLPANTSSKELYDVFSKHGTVLRTVLPPSGVTALIEFELPAEAKDAFRKLAYTKFHHVPLYLEWAPVNVFKPAAAKTEIDSESKEENESNSKLDVTADSKKDVKSKEKTEENDTEPETGATIFVKNLNFDTTEKELKKHFKKCGPIYSVSVSKKVDIRTGKLQSLGFGFVQFVRKSSAVAAVQNFQHSELDGHYLELKFSNRATLPTTKVQRKKMNHSEPKTTKILVRNIPFEVSEKEIRDLFKEFGHLKSVRLPKKPSGEGTHRGFGFVDFLTKIDAKRAFEALCHSTHILGRRLVLEWAKLESEDVSELRKKTARDFYKDLPKAKVKKAKLMEDVMLASKRSNKREGVVDEDDVDESDLISDA